MNIGKGYHLTYCTNIHPGESWAAVYESLQTYLLPLKEKISPNKPFGIGLRLSARASLELEQENNLPEFKNWLDENGLYVHIINGFPYGSFHGTVVKDEVHQPDWTTPERLDYTKRLARILSYLLPQELDGGISTSPLSYKPWLKGNAVKTEEVLRQSSQQLALLVEDLYHRRSHTGRLIHLDIEPEPDGLLETSDEFINFYEQWLMPQAIDHLQSRMGMSKANAEAAVKTHIRLCYDVCHFALAYEEPALVFDRLEKKGIKIGRVQISAALKADLPASTEERNTLATQFEQFSESTYLHQVLVRNNNGTITQYPDLPQALPHLSDPNAVEWRSHFHVPIFLDRYNQLQSTQSEILKVLRLLEAKQVTKYLEVETYTWDVLPAEIKQELGASIQRELQWVIQHFNVQE
ncbi:sugar phosphate isomerase [Adhaeribacter aerolatus]|uniref:Sugar phosphate isomerase n=1 Tax=Adhaeribacter aerolatus TaxID=670289 RepID=A0A512B4T7_9BACT|nr:metabolite traffic protein EboE [Adhaeribacter aerolatus]GEO06960.1 sugar phosphate isomerase [Adhaeribacter aerolatus]